MNAIRRMLAGLVACAILLIGGCSGSHGGSSDPDPETSLMPAEMSSRVPLKSPGGDMWFRIAGRDRKRAVIEDANGKSLADLRLGVGIYSALWSGDGRSILIYSRDSLDLRRSGRIYRYSLREHRAELLDRASRFGWLYRPNARPLNQVHSFFVIYSTTPDVRPEKGVGVLSIDPPQTIHILDPRTLLPVFVSGLDCGGGASSTDGRSISYNELLRGPGGSWDRVDLRIADLRTGKVWTAATGSGETEHVWTCARSIAYVQKQSDGTTSLWRFDTPAGRRTRLTAAVPSRSLTLIGYDKQLGMLYYHTLAASGRGHSRLYWAVRPGGRPVNSGQKWFPAPKDPRINGELRREVGGHP